MSETEHNIEEQKAKKSKLAITSIILGVLGLLIFIPFVFITRSLNPLILGDLLLSSLFLIPQVLGIFFAIVILFKKRKKNKSLKYKKFAIAGLIISILAIPLPLLKVRQDIISYCNSHIITVDDVTQEMSIRLSKEDSSEFIGWILVLAEGGAGDAQPPR